MRDSIESSFEDSNHYIHSIEDTMDHPEFSFTHRLMRFQILEASCCFRY